MLFSLLLSAYSPIHFDIQLLCEALNMVVLPYVWAREELTGRGGNAVRLSFHKSQV